jgi:hypothetical protein
MAFEMVHDLARPVEALTTMRHLGATDAAFLVADEKVASEFQAPSDDPVERLLYAASVLHCLPVGMADSPSAATGTVMRPATLTAYAQAAGLSTVDILPIEHDFLRFYRLFPERRTTTTTHTRGDRPMSDTQLDADTSRARIVAALRVADYPSLADLYAPDAVRDMNLPTWRFQHQGADKIVAYFRDQTGSLPNLRCTHTSAVSTNDTVMVESECRFDGDDGEYLWRCVDIFAVGGDRITRHTQYCTGCWTPADIARQAVEAPMVAW